MPHLVILYTANLENKVDFGPMCRELADTMLAQRDEQGQGVFPLGGTRVFAFPAPHFAVANGQPPEGKEMGFVYLNLRMASGRSADVKKTVGDALIGVLHKYVDAAVASDLVGVTLQIDEIPSSFDGRISSLHPYFNTKPTQSK
ncbi:MAG: 5-carboxymethyl-2-hydroxymuconate isomerase [Alphaproteobacteria bacterium]|nr:5-carboxymethyl-2-hydroxymuconate isomerase [Alphaproteobacteria bacterium]